MNEKDEVMLFLNTHKYCPNKETQLITTPYSSETLIITVCEDCQQALVIDKIPLEPFVL